jgi:uncharacterized membrane protein YqjE
MIEEAADEQRYRRSAQGTPAGQGGGHAKLSGLLTALQNLAASLLAILQTRLELISVEVEEEWLRLAGFLVLGLVCLFCVGMVILLLTALIIAVFWDTYRIQAMVALVLAFALAGVLVWRTLTTRFRNKPAFLGATLAELGRDSEQLRGQSCEQPLEQPWSAGDAR